MFTPEPQIIHYGGGTTKHMADKFFLQLYGSKLIFMKLHGSSLQFQCVRLLIALFFLLRIPFWLAKATISGAKREESMRIAKTYLKGSFYCLTNWKKLLMRPDLVEGKL